jgi:hypothetical protein
VYLVNLPWFRASGGDGSEDTWCRVVLHSVVQCSVAFAHLLTCLQPTSTVFVLLLCLLALYPGNNDMFKVTKNYLQLLARDHLALVTMKNAASCET